MRKIIVASVLTVLLSAACGRAPATGERPASVVVRETVVVRQTIIVPQTVVVRETVPPVIVMATAEPTAQPSTPGKMGEIARGYGYTLTATAIEDPARPSGYYEARPGTRLVAVEIVLANETGEQEAANILNGVLIDAEGFTYAAGLGLIDNPMELIELRQGNRIRGRVGFEIPQNAQPALLRWNVNGSFGEQFLEVGLAK